MQRGAVLGATAAGVPGPAGGWRVLPGERRRLEGVRAIKEEAMEQMVAKCCLITGSASPGLLWTFLGSRSHDGPRAIMARVLRESLL
jgi:hypothetical protein